MTFLENVAEIAFGSNPRRHILLRIPTAIFLTCLFPFAYVWCEWLPPFFSIVKHPIRWLKNKSQIRCVNKYLRLRESLSAEEVVRKNRKECQRAYSILQSFLAYYAGDALSGVGVFSMSFGNGLNIASAYNFDQYALVIKTMGELCRFFPGKEAELLEICNKLTNHSWGAIRNPAYNVIAALRDQ